MGGGKTHRAGFAGGVKSTPFKIDCSEFLASLANRVHLCVGADIGRFLYHIVFTGNDPPAPSDTATERALTLQNPFARLI